MKTNPVIALLFLMMLAAAPHVQAHPANFHLIEDLQEHIEGHLDELRGALAAGPGHADAIRRECAEILEHASDYLQWVARLKKDLPVSSHSRLQEDAHKLLDGAKRQDLPLVLKSLENMDGLLARHVHHA